jgi:hypothetical protein
MGFANIGYIKKFVDIGEALRYYSFELYNS